MNNELVNKLMRRTFELADLGKGLTFPNPLVGSLLVKNGEILSEGFHRGYSKHHAEVDALKELPQDLTRDAELFVNLEPCCSHKGKRNPPCVEAIIQSKVSKVYISNLDLNPEVSGKGVDELRKAGVEVVTDILSEEGKKINKIYFWNKKTQLPYIHIKYAQFFNGNIKPKDKYIMQSEECSRFVHELRKEYQSVLVGSQTLIKDNPFLDTRFDLQEDYNRKFSIILGEIPKEKSNLNVYKTNRGVIELGKRENLRETLSELYNKGVTSILVEGGRKILESFINENLFNEITVITSPVFDSNYKDESLFLNCTNKNIEFSSSAILDGHLVVNGKVL